jgi:hypothetical protein
MNLHLLRMALSHFIGKELTPGVAAHIEYIAMGGDDFGVGDPASFGQVMHQGYAIQVERLQDIAVEAEALHEEFLRETRPTPLGDYAWDKRALIFKERAAQLVQFTIRRDGVLVGQSRMHLGQSLHDGRKLAQEDSFYIQPAHRQGWLAVVFMRFGETVLTRRLGVTDIRCKTADGRMHAAGLLEYLDFKPGAIEWTKTYPREAGQPLKGEKQ